MAYIHVFKIRFALLTQSVSRWQFSSCSTNRIAASLCHPNVTGVTQYGRLILPCPFLGYLEPQAASLTSQRLPQPEEALAQSAHKRELVDDRRWASHDYSSLEPPPVGHALENQTNLNQTSSCKYEGKLRLGWMGSTPESENPDKRRCGEKGPQRRSLQDSKKVPSAHRRSLQLNGIPDDGGNEKHRRPPSNQVRHLSSLDIPLYQRMDTPRACDGSYEAVWGGRTGFVVVGEDIDGRCTIGLHL